MTFIACSPKRGDGTLHLNVVVDRCLHRVHAVSHCWIIVERGHSHTSSMTSRASTSTPSRSWDDLEYCPAPDLGTCQGGAWEITPRIGIIMELPEHPDLDDPSGAHGILL